MREEEVFLMSAKFLRRRVVVSRSLNTRVLGYMSDTVPPIPVFSFFNFISSPHPALLDGYRVKPPGELIHEKPAAFMALKRQEGVLL